MKPSSARKSKFSIKDAHRIGKATSRWESAKKMMVMERFVMYARTKADENNLKNYFGVHSTRNASEDRIEVCLSGSKAKSLFDLFVALINVYLAFSIPFRLAFIEDNGVGSMFIHDLVLDSILLVDLLSRFIEGPAKDDDGFFSVSGKLRRLKPFIRLRFYTDLLSIIPLYMFKTKFYWFKVGRILRVGSLLNWIKTSEISQKFLKKYILKDHYSSEIIFKVIHATMLVAITCHCIACCWYIIPMRESTPTDLTWIGPDYATYSTEDNYMRSLYWTAVTFSSVGYGDITAKTIPEYIYSMFIEFLGIMFFAYLMGSLSSYLAKYSAKKDAVNIRENELNQWLIFLEDQIKDQSFKSDISRKITDFFEQKWACDPTSINNFEDFYMMLPPHLAQSLSEHLFGYRFTLFHTFFDFFPKDLKFHISSMLYSEKFGPKFEIIREGSLNKRIYFIVTGSVGVGLMQMGYALSLPQGSYFGEDSAIFSDESQLSFVTYGECSVLYLEYDEACKLFKRNKVDIYPFATISFKRCEYFLKVTDYKFGDESITDQTNVEDYISQFDIMNADLTFEEEEVFNERSKYMITFNQKKKEKENDMLIEKMKKDAQNYAKQIADFQEGYEKELTKLIKSFDDIKAGKSVKKTIRKLNKK